VRAPEWAQDPIVRLALKVSMRLQVRSGRWPVLQLSYFLARGAASVFLSWGRKSVDLLQEGSSITHGFLCSRSQFWGVYSAGLGCEYRNVLTVLRVTAARCSANLVLRAALLIPIRPDPLSGKHPPRWLGRGEGLAKIFQGHFGCSVTQTTYP
jgi:hypothetical protein